MILHSFLRKLLTETINFHRFLYSSTIALKSIHENPLNFVISHIRNPFPHKKTPTTRKLPANQFSFRFNMGLCYKQGSGLVILSIHCTYNPICLEIRGPFTLFDRKSGFSVNAIRRLCGILIFERRITAGGSRQKVDFSQEA